MGQQVLTRKKTNRNDSKLNSFMRIICTSNKKMAKNLVLLVNAFASDDGDDATRDVHALSLMKRMCIELPRMCLALTDRPALDRADRRCRQRGCARGRPCPGHRVASDDQVLHDRTAAGDCSARLGCSA